MKKTMIASLAALFALAVYAKTSTPEGWLDDYDAALKKAADENKHIVVDFSGSDWCGWCKRLDKEVFATDEFKKAASEKYVLLMVDSPMKKSLLTPKAAKENPKLVEKFGVNGFPTVVVLDPKGEEVCRLGYEKGGPAKYIEKLDAEIRDAPDVKKYIKPIEDVLNSHDSKMEEESRAVMEKVEKKFPKPKEGASKSELRKYRREAMKYAQQVMFEEVYAKYVPLYDKAFAGAKAMKVPANMESRKKDLIDEQESRFEMLKTALKAYEEAKKSGKLDSDDEDEDEDVDEEDDDDFARRATRRLNIPRPEDAKLDTDYWTNVAMPFYERHVVQTLVIPNGMSDRDAGKLRVVRQALARYLATGRDEFPSGEERRAAHELWRAKCRDAAVAIVHYKGIEEDEKYWKGASIFKEAAATHDFDREPVLGFVLRAFAVASARYHVKRKRDEPKKPLKDAVAALEESFGRVADEYKSVDRRILERFSEIIGMPDGVVKAFGDEYLSLCEAANDCMDKASAARGSGWASNVTDDGWDGWNKFNKVAESNLLAAVKLRPEDQRAAMMLSSLSGRTCCSAGDTISWCQVAISNSLDRSAETVERFLHFQTSRWGGSTGFLRDVVFDCSTNVDVRSTFSYHAAAAALQKILVAETEGCTQEGVFGKVVTPDMANALYEMFSAYAAAPESKFMPSRDVFRGMGMGLALQLRDWKSVRRWWKSIEKPLCGYGDAYWLHNTYSPADSGVFLRYMFDILCRSAHAEEFLSAEELAADGRVDDAFRKYEALQRIKNPGEAEKYLADNRYFGLRKSVQDRDGGWVDVMPTRFGGEANHWWSMTRTEKDGRARLERGGNKGYYRLTTTLPGIGVEYEATVYFEKKDDKQKKWNIGWGLGRPYSGYCVDRSSWAYPYIAFSRDEKGDHYAVETFTADNSSKGDDDVDKASRDIGRAPSLVVAEGDLARSDSHAFRLSTGNGRLVVSVDGNVVYEASIDEVMEVSAMSDRIQPNGDVLPVWKLFRNTAFDGYRYRRVPAKEESGAEGRNPQAPAEALKAAIAPLATSMSEIVKNKAYSGGWGYDEKTAVVISAEDEISGVELERPFLLLRSQSEVIAALEKTKLGTKDDIDAVVPTVKSQGLISSGGRSYDSIEYEVCVKLTNGVVFTYDAECWFDITSFFGK